MQKILYCFLRRYLFKENTGSKFEVAEFHKELASTLEKVAKGEITRLIINIPPRYGKTEIAVKMFIAWSLAKNPKAKFIHLSYSDALALDNSSLTKEYVQSDSFQSLWPIELKKIVKAIRNGTPIAAAVFTRRLLVVQLLVLERVPGVLLS